MEFVCGVGTMGYFLHSAFSSQAEVTVPMDSHLETRIIGRDRANNQQPTMIRLR